MISHFYNRRLTGPGFYGLLLLCSCAIYIFYFHDVLFRLNEILSNIEGDSLKNYYTYVYHIKHDDSALEFSGMNFPFGEHVVYTDCQPLLTFILRLLPFTHNHLIGILHSLIFISFIITPLILYRIFRVLETAKLPAFFISLAIAVLSPQYLKILGGHYALAYTSIIPVSILLLLRILITDNLKNGTLLFVWNCLLFLIHPYLGFGSSVFSFIVLFFHFILYFRSAKVLPATLKIFSQGIFPILLFKLFMLLTDSHSNRPEEPQNLGALVSNLGGILQPSYGPFVDFLPKVFRLPAANFEGLGYIGFFSILVVTLLIVLSPFLRSHLKTDKKALSIFLASLALLLLAFGYHLELLNFTHVKISAIDQFRATGRFVWFFYYGFLIFLFHVIYRVMTSILKSSSEKWLSLFGILFLCVNLYEANYLFLSNRDYYWKSRNLFNENMLNEEEKNILQHLKQTNPQAIIPLPVFHFGSEMFERFGFNNSAIPSFMYSYHSGTPILSVMLSRTSLSETQELLQVLNPYKKHHSVSQHLDNRDFFTIQTKDALFPSETRLAQKIKRIKGNDSLIFGSISTEELWNSCCDSSLTIDAKRNHLPDSIKNLVFVSFKDQRPFVASSLRNFETIYSLDSNSIKSGDYVVSFHYHSSLKNYRDVSGGLIIAGSSGKDYIWTYNIPLNYMAGFYGNYGVFEYKVSLEKKNKYDFMIKGDNDHLYHVSDFMLRPETLNVKLSRNGKEESCNNFSYK